MDITLIANAISIVLTGFLSNTGSEIAKSLGKDIYEKVKESFHKDEEKKVLQKLEAEPFSTEHQECLERLLTTKLADKAFLQNITVNLKITSSNNFILERVLNSIQDIKAQLNQLYPCVVNSSVDKAGDYHNRINYLESELRRLDFKFWAIIRSST